MAISTNENTVVVVTDGIETSFTVNYVVHDPNTIFVYLNAGSGEIELTNFTVEVNDDQDSNAGAVITFDSAPEAGNMVIARVLPILQGSVFSEYQRFPSKTVERGYDLLTMMVQQINERASRSMAAPITEEGVDLELPPYAAGHSFMWSQTEKKLVATEYPLDTIIAAVGVLADDALASADAAAVDAAAVDAALKDFETRYLGPFASAPSADNEGDPLAVGALYWNTGTQLMKLWDGAAWVNAVAGGTAATKNFGTNEDELPESQNVVLKDSITGAAQLPVGDTAARPSPLEGMFRFNNETGEFEGYKAGSWSGVGGASGGAGNPFMYQHDATVSQDYTLTTGQNAISGGPLEINATVTVESGAVWSIV